MKAHEVRLGNLYDHDGEVKPVTPNIIEHLWANERTWCKPVPLTEDWAITFKFEPLQDGWFELNAGAHIITWNIYDKVMRLNGIAIPHIEYVHEVQNLIFALTGEEYAYTDNQ